MKNYNTDLLRKMLLELFTAFLLGALLFWIFFTPKTIPKQVVCRDYIGQNFELSKQLENLQVSLNLQKTDLIKKIKLKETKMCLSKIEKYKALCETIRCEICKRK